MTGRPTLRSRLAFDFRVARKMQNEHLSLAAFASVDDAIAERVLADDAALKGHAAVYLVTYRFRMITRESQALPEARVLFNLLAGDYPLGKPSAQVNSQPLPFAPHVHPRNGAICLGETWEEAKGEMLFGQLAIHVMHLLNMDERDPGGSLDGFDVHAIDYWRDQLRGRPLNPGLRYPALPTDDEIVGQRVLAPRGSRANVMRRVQ